MPRTGAVYALHLGDYIYEYGSDTAKYGRRRGAGPREHPGPRHRQPGRLPPALCAVQSDADLQALHANMPWITVWDDHEFANNAYVAGAENHTAGTQGDWDTRMAAPPRPTTSGCRSARPTRPIC